MSSFFNYIRNEVVSVANQLNISYEELDSEIRKDIFNSLFVKYLSIGKYDFPMYAFLVDSYAIQNENAWRWVEDYIGDEEVILFFEQNDDRNFIEFKNGADLVNIIGGSFLFTFYLTNRNTDYLLIHNRYDFIIASGNSIPWLINRGEKEKD